MAIDYKKYVGQYVKRFYTPFDANNIWEIASYREVRYFEDGMPKEPIPEFLYRQHREEFWTDVEDSVIITNEMPIITDERIANVNHPRYVGYNPFTDQEHLDKSESDRNSEDEDVLLADCIEYAKSEGKIRRGTLQRKFKLGYFRAGRIMSQMELKGVFKDGATGRHDSDREVVV